MNLLQLFFGGLLSTLLVFYFRSGSLSASWPFLLVLGVAFAANESLREALRAPGLSDQPVLPFAFLLRDFHCAGLGARDGTIPFVLSGGGQPGAGGAVFARLGGDAKETMLRAAERN